MNPWWLLLICPACAFLGFMAAAICAASAQADAIKQLEALRKETQEHLESMKK